MVQYGASLPHAVAERRTTNRPSPSSSVKPRGVLYVVATPIGNLEDVTLRAIRILGEVATIAAEDTRRTSKLLTHYGIQTPTLSFHEHNEHQKTPKLIALLDQCQSVGLVTDAGTPLLSDPGAGLVRAALARGIDVCPVPGASAILAALVVSGLSQRQFTFAGFPPNRSQARKKWLQPLASEQRPLVIFESPHRLIGLLTDMMDVFGDRDVAICREMTKLHEELAIGPISSVLPRFKHPRGEFTIVVSPGPEEIVPVNEHLIRDEFSLLTKYVGSRRTAVTQIARNHGLSAREVYRILEDGKKL